MYGALITELVLAHPGKSIPSQKLPAVIRALPSRKGYSGNPNMPTLWQEMANFGEEGILCTFWGKTVHASSKFLTIASPGEGAAHLQERHQKENQDFLEKATRLEERAAFKEGLILDATFEAMREPEAQAIGGQLRSMLLKYAGLAVEIENLSFAIIEEKEAILARLGYAQKQQELRVLKAQQKATSHPFKLDVLAKDLSPDVWNMARDIPKNVYWDLDKKIDTIAPELDDIQARAKAEKSPKLLRLEKKQSYRLAEKKAVGAGIEEARATYLGGVRKKKNRLLRGLVELHELDI